ncbi:MAG TPA: HAD family hydrolase [Microlunatus sp.]|nr:HAD family hydrolase [Microlunatus sp.]
MRPELVLFDCDGVLVDSERLTVAVEARVLTTLGWAMTEDEVVRRWMGRTGSAQVAEVAERLGPEVAERYDAESTAQVHRAFATELTEVDGISTLVDRLEEAGVPFCVASSGTHTRMETTLGITGLDMRFRGRIFSATEVARGKPAPDLFLHAAARMGAEPAGCVVIEDSPFGVRAGVAAGMRVLGYGGGLAAADALAEAGAEVFGHMSEVPALLGL